MATIKDISAKTGFSLMTVSRAFNSPEMLKPATLNAIMEAAAECDYHPNNVARSLARKKTNIVFVYIPKGLSATEPFVTRTVTAIGERLGEYGYSFLLSRKLPSGESFDGVIAMGMSHDEEKNVVGAKNIVKPLVLYGNNADYSSWVDVDNYAGGKLATEYLISKGRKRIAAICAPQKMHYAEERLDGYKACLTEHGFAVDEDIIVAGEADENGGYECCLRLLRDTKGIDAVFCATDSMAIGCMRALAEKGIAVPKDISVVGFDGFGSENVVVPKLTTVKQPLFEVGTMLADVLVSVMEGAQPKRIKILPTLSIGESA